MSGPPAAPRLEKLTAGDIMTAGNGDHLDGGGLQLRRKGIQASWVYRFVSPNGHRRAIGLGVARLDREDTATASLFAARAAAASSREMLLCGIDPWENREALRRVVKETRAGQMALQLLTLSQAAHDFHKRVIEPTHDDAYSRNWIGMLERHVPSAVWNRRLDDISPPTLLRALNGMTASKSAAYLPAGPSIPMTVRRVRACLDRVFDDAMFFGRCRTNPAAALRRKLREGETKPVRGHYAALPYPFAPALYARLLQTGGTVARCLEFSILTASRKIETTMATWPEFKLEEGTWTVPKERMKGRRDHIVFLTDRAVEIVRGQRGLDTKFVFPSMYSLVGNRRHVLEGSLRYLLLRLDAQKRTTLHGLCRATFSTWAYETSNFRSDVIEACLAHRESDLIKAAYNRAEFQNSRRQLLRDWDEFLNPTIKTNVTPIRAVVDNSLRLVSSRPSASPPPNYLRMRDVMDRVDLCQASIYTKVRKNTFPKPVKFGYVNGWQEADIIAWLKQAYLDGRRSRKRSTPETPKP